MNKEIRRTLLVALLVSLVCSILVSVTSVVLRDKQQANAKAAVEKTIVQVSGLTGVGIDDFTPLLVDFNSGCISSVSPESYNLKKALLLSDKSSAVPRSEDIARINRREHLAKIWLYGTIHNPEVLIFPVRGYGLWGTMHGFIALAGDLKTVRGIEIYEHKETPGLGGEVENPKWKVQWNGKTLFDDQWNVVMSVIKGQIQPSTPSPESKISGLSGATLTTKGLDNMIKYWFDEANLGGIIQCIDSLGTPGAQNKCSNLEQTNCTNNQRAQIQKPITDNPTI